MRAKERKTIVKVPRNVRPETLREIKEHMKNKPYRIVVYERKHGWNALIPVVKK